MCEGNLSGSSYVALHIVEPCSAATVPVPRLNKGEGRLQEPMLL